MISEFSWFLSSLIPNSIALYSQKTCPSCLTVKRITTDLYWPRQIHEEGSGNPCKSFHWFRMVSAMLRHAMPCHAVRMCHFTAQLLAASKCRAYIFSAVNLKDCMIIDIVQIKKKCCFVNMLLKEPAEHILAQFHENSHTSVNVLVRTNMSCNNSIRSKRNIHHHLLSIHFLKNPWPPTL